MTTRDDATDATEVTEATEVPARLSPWAPLRHRIFLALFIAQMASNVGTLMQSVGSAWYMGDLHGSPALVALVQTATFLPVFIVGIPGGALADIVDRRRLLLVTQMIMMAAAVALTVLAFAHRVTPLSLLVLTFALGLGTALNGPAWQAIQPDLVPRRELSQALSLGALTYNVGRAIGPALGGLVLAAAGPAWVFAVNALSFLGTVLVLAAWRQERPESRLPSETLAGATRAAMRYGMNAPVLRRVLVRVAALMVPAAALQALLPIVVRDSLHRGSGTYGALLACFGVGAAVAAVLRPRFEERLSRDGLLVLATVLLAVGLLVDGFVHEPVAVGAGLFAAGVGWTTAFTTTNVAAQSTLAAWVRARGMGLYMLVLTGGIALGSALWGTLAGWSLAGAHLVAGLMLLSGLFLVRRWPIATTATIDASPVTGVDPVVTLVPRPDDGPVLVTVTYHVPFEKVRSFVEAMRGIERHRRRTGAYQWNLFRDLAAPDRFVETFVVDSWAEHLRQHSRNTTATDARLEIVRAYSERGVDISHLISAYSPGALEAVELQGTVELQDAVERPGADALQDAAADDDAG
ncbi:MAG: transporter [Acidimicrobiales bacterium]|nr:transporter [Acidimicrobiales bacterium]